MPKRPPPLGKPTLPEQKHYKIRGFLHAGGLEVAPDSLCVAFGGTLPGELLDRGLSACFGPLAGNAKHYKNRGFGSAGPLARIVLSLAF